MIQHQKPQPTIRPADTMQTGLFSLFNAVTTTTIENWTGNEQMKEFEQSSHNNGVTLIQKIV